jgi:rod shape-determining protein MreC
VATARPGWSRRAQYGLFFSFIAVIAGIIVGLILLTVSLLAPQQFQRIRGAALDEGDGLERLGAAARRRRARQYSRHESS